MDVSAASAALTPAQAMQYGEKLAQFCFPEDANVQLSVTIINATGGGGKPHRLNS